MLEAQVLSFVNQERAALNAAPLAHDAGLATAAASWSQEMARSGIRHDPGLSAAMVAGGFSQMGEVLHSDRASRSDGGAAIVASWRGSSRHWAILTDPTATLAGFGLHVAVESGDGATLLRLYATGRVGSLLAGR
jgi:uncharacterized protein YkwD